MRAFLLEGDPPVGGVRSVEIPRLKPGEALIKVRLAGICRTDLEIAKGYMGFQGIPGHEFVGEVVEVDSSTSAEANISVGARVVGEINCGCGVCEWCQRGMSRHCPHRTVLGIQGRPGCLAEYVTLPLTNLHIVPDSVPDKMAVFTEPLAAALEIFEQVHLQPNTRVLVIGDGKLGLLIARVLQLQGCDLLSVGAHQAKLDILRGWSISAVPHSEYLPDARDLVIEASGSPGGFHLALKSVRPRGTLVLKSTYHGALTLDVALLVINEITVIGSRCGPFPPALNYLEQGLLSTPQLITQVYPANDLERAFQHAAQSEAIKILVDFT